MSDEQQQDSIGAKGHSGISFTLTVHMADGTTKEIPCVGHVTSVQKEQDNDDLRS